MGSSLRIEGVATVLHEMQSRVTEKVRARFVERRAQGRNDLSDEEIESLARIAGMEARSAGADAVGQSFQMGVDRSATAFDHEHPTTPVPCAR